MSSQIIENYLSERRANEALSAKVHAISAGSEDQLAEILTLAPSVSILSEMLSFIDEISIRDKVEKSEILKEVVVCSTAVQSEKNKSKKDALKAARELLKKKRFPEMARIENDLKDCVKEIVKDSGVRVELPKDLEGDTLTLTLKARSPEDLENLSKKLSVVSSHQATQKIFSILKGE